MKSVLGAVHEIHWLYCDLVVEFTHRDCVKEALGSRPQHFALKKLHSVFSVSKARERQTQRQKEGGRIPVYLGESKEGSFPLLRCVLSGQGIGFLGYTWQK